MVPELFLSSVWSVKQVAVISAALFVVGVSLRKAGTIVARKERQKALLLNAGTENIRAALVKFQAENAFLPAVPVNLTTDYEGWFEEALKRVQLRSVHRTREEQLKLARQAEELGRLFNSIVDNRERMQESILTGEKRRRELKHDMELQPLEKKRRQLQLQCEIEELKSKLQEFRQPTTNPKTPTPIEEVRKHFKARLEKGAAISSVEEEMIQEHPELKNQIKRMSRKMLEDEQEGW